MISGLNASGIASAIRTAGRARETMDTMARQIATGQRVASVKDDGAAWARAAQLRSDQVTWSGRRDVLTLVKTDMEAYQAAVTQQQMITGKLQELVLAARAHEAGSRARINLQAEWAAWVQAASDVRGNAFAFQNATFVTDGWNSGIELSAADSFLSGSGRFLVDPTFDTNFITGANPAQGRPIAPSTVNLAAASTANLDDTRTSLTTILGNGPTVTTFLHLRNQEGARDIARAERMIAQASRFEDTLQFAIGSLTDADLGRASAARAQAETRQQLALSTVRQAISTYASFAGGLLGNVQRTQRGVLA